MRKAICWWVVGITGLLAQVQERKSAASLLQDLSQSFEELSRRVAPAVVQIIATGYGPVEDGGQTNVGLVARHRSTGSGVIVDPGGFIVTNAHVVEGAQRVRVLLPPAPQKGAASGRAPVDAKIAGVDKTTDLAVLKVERTGLPTLIFGNSDSLRQGQIVLALGSPLGLQNSLSMGVVSSTERQLRPDDTLTYIQTDAPINPGNSGGPLVDVQGHLVGINTFILSQSGGSEGIGFAIPSSVVRAIYRQLRKNGHVHRGEIGAAVQSITPLLAAGLGLPQDFGIIVSDVTPDSPAARAGLKLKDIVLTLNGRAMPNARRFENTLYRQAAGEQATLELLRESERLTLKIPVIERTDGADRLAEMVTPEKHLIPKFGLLGISIDRAVAEMLPGLREHYGVVVAAKAAYVPSQEVPVEPGDVIHAINQTRIATLETLRAAVEALKPGDPVVLEIERPGRTLFVAFEME